MSGDVYECVCTRARVFMCLCMLVSWEVLMLSDPLVLKLECQAVWGLEYRS